MKVEYSGTDYRLSVKVEGHGTFSARTDAVLKLAKAETHRALASRLAEVRSDEYDAGHWMRVQDLALAVMLIDLCGPEAFGF